MWLSYLGRGVSHRGFLLPPLDLSQQNQVWPLTQRKWFHRESVECRGSDSQPLRSIRPWGPAGDHLTRSDLDTNSLFPLWSFFQSVPPSHSLTSKPLTCCRTFNLFFFSAIQVWRSFIPPSRQTTYVCPLAIFLCSCSNKWSSSLLPLMSVISQGHWDHSKQTKSSSITFIRWQLPRNQFPPEKVGGKASWAYSACVWEMLLYFYCSSPVMRLAVRARVAAWIASIG